MLEESYKKFFRLDQRSRRVTPRTPRRRSDQTSVFAPLWIRFRFWFAHVMLLLFKDPARSFDVLSGQRRDGTWTESFAEHRRRYRRVRLFSLSGLAAVFVALVATVVLLNTTLPSRRQFTFAKSYSWIIPSDSGYAWTDHLSPTADSDIPASNPDNATISNNRLLLSQKTTAITQTNWAGGPGQLNLSNATKFYTSSNVEYSGAGQLSLSVPTNDFSENFSGTTKADTSNSTAVWETSRAGGGARVDTENESLAYRGGGNVKDITAQSAGDNEIWAVVDHFILKKDPSGWDSPDAVLTSTSYGSFTAIASANASDKWAATDQGVLYRTSSSVDWTRVASGESDVLPCGSGVAINDIAAIEEASCGSSCDLWVACNDGNAAVSSDSGTTWTKRSSGFSVVKSISATSASVAIAVSGQDTNIRTTLNGGSSWVNADTGSSQNMNGIYAFSASAIVAVGNAGTIRVYNGISWSNQTSGISTNLRAVHGTNSSNAWAVGDSGTILQTSDGGSNWNNRTNASITTNTLNAVEALTSTTAGIVGNNGDLISATDSGSTLAEQFSGTNTTSNNAVAFANRSRGWVVGDSGKILFNSTNGNGSGWSAQTNPCGASANISDVSAVWSSSCTTNCVAWIACSDGKVAVTSNSGTSWGTPTNPSVTFTTIAAASATRAFGADASGNVYRYNDSGGIAGWSTNLNPGGNVIRQLEAASSSVIWGVGNGNTVIASTDGLNFSAQSSPLGSTVTLTDIEAMDVNNAFISASNGSVLVTSNAGTTWTEKVVDASSNLLAVAAQSNRVLTAISGTYSTPGNKLYTSKDGGSTWASTTYDGNLKSIAYQDEQNLMMVGATNGLMMQWTGSFKTSGLAQSATIDEVSANIAQATLTATSTLNSQTISYQMSANGGTNWENVTSGSEHTFANAGSDLRFRATLNQSDPAGYPPAYLNEVDVSYKAGYAASGTLTSSIMDLGTVNTEWGSPSATSTLNGETLSVRVRTGNTSDLSDAVKSNIADCAAVTLGQDMSNNECVRDGDRYGQYHLTLATSNPNSATPVVQDTTFQSLIFGSIYHDFDAEGTASWSQLIPNEIADSAEINMKYRLKTASTQAGLANATWSSFFDQTSAISLASLDASRFLRVESRIETTDTDNVDDGDLLGFELVRLQNGAPDFNPNFNGGLASVVQNPTGTVTIATQLRDADTNSGSQANRGKVDVTYWYDRGLTLAQSLSESATTMSVNSTTGLPGSGTVLLESEIMTYTGLTSTTLTGVTRGQRNTRAASHFLGQPAPTVWFKTETITGDGLVSVEQVNYSETSATWTPATDYSATFNAIQSMLVFANDRESLYNTAVQHSSSFGLDTKAPVAGTSPILINSGAAKSNSRNVTLTIDATDQSSITVAFSNDGKKFGTQLNEDGEVTNDGSTQAYRATNTWSLGAGEDGERTVHVKFRDAFGNVSGVYSDAIDLDTLATSIVKNFAVTDASHDEVKRYWALLGWNSLSAEKNPDFNHYKVEVTTDGKNYSTESTIQEIGKDYYLDQDVKKDVEYSYRIRGVDDIGNESDPSTVVTVIPGSADTKAPKFQGEPTLKNVSGSNATLAWVTDELSDSCIEYGETEEYGRMECVRGLTKTHEIEVENLKSSLKYHYRLVSKDSIGNEAVSGNYNFTTKISSNDVVPPEILLPGPKVDASFKDAIVTWETNELSDSFVEFGSDVTYGSTQGDPKMVKKHSARIIGLTPLIEYHYRVHSRDASGNEGVSKDLAFLTKAPEGRVAPPAISGIEVIAPEDSDRSAIIRWKTDTLASSKVGYGTSIDRLDFGSSEDLTLNLDHVVTLNDLLDGTTYFFKVYSADEFGQQSDSDIRSFATTASAGTPEISEVSLTDIGLDSFIASWTTSLTTSSVVDVGPEKDYGTTIADDPEALVTRHVVKVTNLARGSRYHVRLSGASAEGKTVVSDDYIVRTRALPSISSFEINDVTSNSARLTWKTNELTDSIISFGKSSDIRVEQGFSEMSLDHEVVITGLASQTQYLVRAKSRDATGNLTESKDLVLETPQDTSAPVISAVSSETSVVGSGDIAETQLIISWKTDEPSTSQVHYSKGLFLPKNREGSAIYPLASSLDAQLKTNHVVILNVGSASTYHYRVVSTDSSLNTSYSNDFTALTPTQRKTVLERVLTTLTTTFSWVERLRELLINE